MAASSHRSSIRRRGRATATGPRWIPAELAGLIRGDRRRHPGRDRRAGRGGAEVVAIGVTGMAEAGRAARRRGPRARAPSSRGTIRAATSTSCAARSARTPSSEPVGMPLNAQPSLHEDPLVAAHDGHRGRLPCASSPCRSGASTALAVCRSASSRWRAARACSTSARWRRSRALSRCSAGSAVRGRDSPARRRRANGAAVAASVRGAVLTVAGHDHQAAALAVGAARPGELFNSMGTARGTRALRRRAARRPPSYASPRGATTAGRGVVRGCYAVMEGLRTGARAGTRSLAARRSRSGRPRLLGEEAHAVDLANIPPGLVVNDGDREELVLGALADGLLRLQPIWAAVVRDLTAASVRRLERIAAEVGPHAQRDARRRLDAQCGRARREAPPAR